ncbi:MAG: HAD-IA family hydrolase [Elainellaceae cyanobacterium]
MYDNQPITHVIYDLDGLLLDTESLIDRVNAIITGHYGKAVDSSIKSKIAGRNALESAQILIDDLELPLTPHDYLQHKDTLIDDIYPQAQPLPGVISLIQHLHHHKIPQAVATSSSQRPFSLKTMFHHAWFDLFDCIVTGDDPDIGAGKPAPDIFLIAAARMGASPATCLVFEDSLAGVAAARSAGMSVVAVPDASMDWQRYQDAHQILSSLTEFKPEHWHLPAQ